MGSHNLCYDCPFFSCLILKKLTQMTFFQLFGNNVGSIEMPDIVWILKYDIAKNSFKHFVASKNCRTFASKI